ncbi:MAG: tRNA1(Val) (adenine(37)-N6)-methyltransferase [Psychrilyobacter sp.]|nr:tRNA1(Val) (adenine(37)-N6)-methyltransferase [Psychrilyobacter sp.]
MREHSNEVIIDFLNHKGMKIIQRNDFLNFSIDSVLVSNFLTINKNRKKIIDLGTGNGVIPMLLSMRTEAKITGIEIQDISVDLAKRNIILNKLESKVEIIKGDIKEINLNFKDQSYDAVITNPPFFKFNGDENQLNNLDQLTFARHEILINLEDIIKAGSYLLKNRGCFTMVHRADRLIDILELMKKYKLEPKRIRFIHTTMEKSAKIILVEGLKGVKPGLTIEPPLYINEKSGKYTQEVLRMFGNYN